MLSLRTITRGLLDGKSLVRIYQNHELMRAPIAGRVLNAAVLLMRSKAQSMYPMGAYTK